MQLPVQTEYGCEVLPWRALLHQMITSRSWAEQRDAPRDQPSVTRSCDLAKATETVTLRVSQEPQGVTVKLGAEAD